MRTNAGQFALLIRVTALFGGMVAMRASPAGPSAAPGNERSISSGRAGWLGCAHSVTVPKVMSAPQIISVPIESRARRVQVAPLGMLRRHVATARGWLPRGHLLSDDAWASRHRAVVKLLWAHVVAVFVFALWTDHGVIHGATEASVVAAAAIASQWGGFGRTMRSAVASFGLVSASAIFVHLSGGYIEAHFHFFVMIAVISLYQEWLPFLVAIAYVVIHHAVLGVVDPGVVFNNPVAQANPCFGLGSTAPLSWPPAWSA
jgi:hypothetical protein